MTAPTPRTDAYVAYGVSHARMADLCRTLETELQQARLAHSNDLDALRTAESTVANLTELLGRCRPYVVAEWGNSTCGADAHEGRELLDKLDELLGRKS